MGVLPSRIAYRLSTYGVDRFRVTRRIKVVNRRPQKGLGYDAAEKVGHKWALTDFMIAAWGVKKRILKESRGSACAEFMYFSFDAQKTEFSEP